MTRVRSGLTIDPFAGLRKKRRATDRNRNRRKVKVIIRGAARWVDARELAAVTTAADRSMERCEVLHAAGVPVAEWSLDRDALVSEVLDALGNGHAGALPEEVREAYVALLSCEATARLATGAGLFDELADGGGRQSALLRRVLARAENAIPGFRLVLD